MIPRATVRQLRGRLSILGDRFYDGLRGFSRGLLLVKASSLQRNSLPWPGDSVANASPVECAVLRQGRGCFLQLRTKRILATSLFAITWIATVGYGLGALFQNENAPGPVGKASQEWTSTQIVRATDRPTLVMLAHPHCPCTRASIGELAQIMARLRGRVAAYVLLVKPKTAGRDWEDTDLRRSAEAIPGVRVLFDLNGAEARHFGVETSGHTLLFDADGRQLFSGGITASRGHAGDNAGERALVALVNRETPALIRTRVFGCSLANRSETKPPVLCLK